MPALIRSSSIAAMLLAALSAPAAGALTFLGSYQGSIGMASFGEACIVIGDMDGDGAAEFAIGAPTDPVGGGQAGRVFIYRGGNPLPELPSWVISGLPGDRLGASLATAYVDDDFVPDLIIGAPGSSDMPGRVVIAYGSNPIGARPLRSVNGAEPGSRFGAAVDGLAPFGSLRFIVGAPAFHSDAGAVHAYAQGDPPPATPTFVLHAAAEEERFGAALSTAGITRGFISGPEFLVAAPGKEGSGAPGRYALYYYDAPNDTTPDLEVMGESAGLELGRSISGGVDINSNFFEPSDDWVVGAPGDVDGGSAFAAGWTYHGPVPRGGRFGSTVRLMNDVTRSSAPDMAIADGAAVHVYAGPLSAVSKPVARLEPDGDGEAFGRSISNSGRMNPTLPRGQFMVGAPDALAATGKVYVYFDPTPPTSVPPPTVEGGIRFGPPTPNPSHGAFTWALRLDRAIEARLSVLDLAGREVAKLHDGPMAPGDTEFEWRPAPACAPGIYWAVLEAEGRRASRRMVRLR